MLPGGQRSDVRVRMALALVSAVAPLAALAQPAPTTAPSTPAGESASPPWLRVLADSVNLRSRPDANSIIVMRVERDAVLKAGGRDAYGWYPVEPPAGAFSYVGAAYVDRRGPTEGVVSVREGTLRVRVGSRVHDLDPWQSEVQARLEAGARVRIVGEQGDWLKIEPPPGVRLYVSAEHVAPIDDETAARLRAAESATSRPAEQGGPPPAPMVVEPDLRGPWGQRLVMVEAAIAAESERLPAEQQWDGILARLRPIAEQREEPAVARLASAWMTQLQQRQAELAALREADEVVRRLARDQAQHERELERIARARQAATRPAPEVRGELRRSDALELRPGQRWYKLLDPLTGRVTAYLEVGPTAKPDPDDWVGRYVAVRGSRRPAPHLGADILEPEEITPVGPAEPASQPARTEP